MRSLIKGRQVDIDPQPIIIASLILGWALYYYFDTVSIPYDGPESVLFIKPLVIGILICFPLVVFSSIKIQRTESVSEKPEEEKAKADRGFLDHRRIFFAGALVTYALTITFFGYLIPSILFIFSVVFYLGSRSIWILMVLPIGFIVFVSLLFKVLLKVPIPLWPSG